MIGVLAFHGDFAEHLAVLKSLKVEAVEVRNVEDLEKVDRLIIPGGESTVIAKFLESTGVGAEIKRRAQLPLPGGEGRGEGEFHTHPNPLTPRPNDPIVRIGRVALSLRERELSNLPLAIYGTCAGSILLAKTVTGKTPPPTLGLMDIEIERNAYGTQLQSFETTLKLKLPPWGRNVSAPRGAPECSVHASFIRAPIIRSVGKNVEILATHGGHPVLVRQGRMLAGTFHPEVRGVREIHELFLRM